MSFNLGVSFNNTAAQFAIRSEYLYLDAAYRRWITQIALAFYTGRQDNFVWLDLKKQFRNPEKMQIIPYNLTKEIIDETSILYREEPIYNVKDKDGKILPEDTKLWKRIRQSSRYHTLCQQLDSMTKLLGTVLVKVSFVNPETGDLVNADQPGMVQFDLVYGGLFDVEYVNSPYYINSLDFDFSGGDWVNKPFNNGNRQIPISSHLSVATRPTDTTRISNNSKQVNLVQSTRDLGRISKVKWGIKDHRVEDEDGNIFEGENPYGCIPAIPFFNQDPGNYFFLPVNEPLIYANHAINMRLSDLNHITKYQSFGQAVVKGIERPVNTRLGRPVDDFNARSGSRPGFGFGFGGDIGPTGLDRRTNNAFGYYEDGNATANQLGYSLGPDTVVSVGETGDFKYVSPQADIKGLVTTIYTMMDMVRINHGLRAKHDQTRPTSGAAIQFDKLGVLEQNRKRSHLFKEREQQLFQIVKRLWNIHHEGTPEKKFNGDAELSVHYIEPDFAVDPQTKITTLKQEYDLLATGNTEVIRKLKPHLDDQGIKELLDNYHKDRMEQAKRNVEHDNYIVDNSSMPEAVEEGKPKDSIRKPKIENRAEHSLKSSIQPKNGDPRESEKQKRVKQQADKTAQAKL
jgi:hypothetical protein